MSAQKFIKLPILNVPRDGDYTCAMDIGANAVKANLILDTGSSVLAVHSGLYSPGADPHAELTQLAQTVSYKSGSWVGAVVRTSVGAGLDGFRAELPSVATAAVYSEQGNMFGGADGILGLAYKTMDEAHVMPGPTWPASFSAEQISGAQKTPLQPYFTRLEEADIVANRFAFATRRSRVSHATSDPASDPLNQGFLLMGACEAHNEFQSGPFRVVSVVHDKFYNTTLRSVQVGDDARIPAPPLTWSKQGFSNSIVDSGTNSIMLAPDIYGKVVAAMSTGKYAGHSSALGLRFSMMSDLDLTTWPPLTFVLAGPDGDVSLVVKPETYWQTNSPAAGVAKCVLNSTGGSEQSILGLPLLNNHYTVFDRSAQDGLGVIRFSDLKDPA